jgi:hypothetical protein
VQTYQERPGNCLTAFIGLKTKANLELSAITLAEYYYSTADESH